MKTYIKNLIQETKISVGSYLIIVGTLIMGFYENYNTDSYVVANGERCAACRNCGSPTQTTTRVCWRCIPPYTKIKTGV